MEVGTEGAAVSEEANHVWVVEATRDAGATWAPWDCFTTFEDAAASAERLGNRGRVMEYIPKEDA